VLSALQPFFHGLLLPLHLLWLLRGTPGWRPFVRLWAARTAAVVLLTAVVVLVEREPQQSEGASPRGIHFSYSTDDDLEEGKAGPRGPSLGGKGSIALVDPDDTDPEGVDLDEQRAEREEPARPRWWARLGWLLSIVLGAQWLVVALTRDWDDQLSARIAEVAGAPVEEAPARPRVRLDLRWVWRKLKRRIWAGLAMLPGFVVIGAVVRPLSGTWLEAPLSTALGAAWTFYWWTVGTTSKTASAWANEATARPPFFLRGVLRLTERWAPVRWIGRLWASFTRRLYPPAEALEGCPRELAGLSLARLIGGLPLVSLSLRAVVPVAGALLMAGRPVTLSSVATSESSMAGPLEAESQGPLRPDEPQAPVLPDA
jgi:hypothetical protein